jgi:hypothetical protein
MVWAAISAARWARSGVRELRSLYDRYLYLKRENETMKKYLGAICFADHKRHPLVQAADMLAHPKNVGVSHLFSPK